MAFNNGLTGAQLERLAILAEEMGEALQAVGKILRHGYESYDPTLEDSDKRSAVGQNRRDLVKELGDVTYAIEALCCSGDVSYRDMVRRFREKSEKIKPYLRHQEKP